MCLHRISNSKELALFQFTVTLTMVAATSVAAQPKEGCEGQCGDISIPYPFGLGNDCNINSDFFITCNITFNPPKAFLTYKPQNAFNTTGNFEVLNISLDGYLRIMGDTGYACYNSSGLSSQFFPWITLSKFPISQSRNKFTAVGCDTFAYMRDHNLGRNYTTGCLSFCNNVTNVINGSCSGIGCCQTAIPKGVRSYDLSFSEDFKHSNCLNFNPCSYGFVVEDGAYNFSISDLSVVDFGKKVFSLILDWTIGNQTCIEAKMDRENYACQENSKCIDAEAAPGYLCKCHDGFQGNLYLSNGCQDVNECNNTALNNCKKPEYCVNKVGNYTCKCPKGYHGDGRKDGYGQGCIRNQMQIVQIALGISISSVAVIALSGWLFLLHKKRKLIELKDKFFMQNGGAMLQQLTRREASSETVKIFTAEELRRATNNYDESMIVGCGGYGTVYKGVLEGNNLVAIKKSKIVDQGQIEQFINEVVVLSKINHRNVVRLLGCCLEVEVPLLVYEFVTNGTLFDHIHDKGRAAAMPWGTRLRIAAETAGVLSYLHSAASIPIIHRDVKTSNILLDDNYTAKVSDFGASRLIPIDQTQLSTMVQGTLDYLDPEYLRTSQLTEKSDVYSFGVVLVELLTGKKALSFDKPEEERSLARYFLFSLRRECLFDILESNLVDAENRDQIMEVAKLAMRCLEIKGEERPSMKEVAMELEGLKLTGKHSWVNADLNSEETETEYLLK